jgi:hypothetical protein
MMRVTTIALAGVLLAAANAQAQDKGFNPWLNARIDSLVAMRIAMRDGAKLATIPSGVVPGADLVERAAMPDITGIAVKLPEGDHQTTATSIAGTLYMLVGLTQGSPLDPARYLSNSVARRIGFDVTLDRDTSGGTSTAVQGKVLIRDRPDPLTLDSAHAVSNALNNAADSFAELSAQVQDILFKRAAARNQSKLAFINSLADSAGLQAALQKGGKEALIEIDRAIEKHIAAFETLRTTVMELSAQARRRPLFAVSVTGGAIGTEIDVARALLIYDVSRTRYDITVNAGYEFIRGGDDDLEEQNRIAAAAQFLWKITRDNRLDGRAVLSLAIAGSAAMSLQDDNDPVFKLQARLLIPITDGVNIPVSATWASRRDLIDESRLRGNVGFSVDLAQILAVLR